MQKSSKAYIEAVSSHCYAQLTYYRFNTNTLQVDDKYREGRLSALNYVSELTYYYLQQEKRLKEEFRQQIIKQMKQYICLNESPYKQGLYDGLNDMLNAVP